LAISCAALNMCVGLRAPLDRAQHALNLCGLMPGQNDSRMLSVEAQQAMALLLAARPAARISTIVDQMMFPECLRISTGGLGLAGLSE
jgi:hypothetical protein